MQRLRGAGGDLLKPALQRLYANPDGRWYVAVENDIFAAADRYVTYGPYGSQHQAAEGYADLARLQGNRRCWFRHDWHELAILESLNVAVTAAVSPMGWWVRPDLPWSMRDRICKRCGLIRRSLTDALVDFLESMPLFARVDTERLPAIWRNAPVHVGLDPVPDTGAGARLDCGCRRGEHDPWICNPRLCDH